MLQGDIYTVLPAAHEAHTHTIIFLHGRDSLAEEFASEIFESQASDGKTLPESLPNFKWVFPSSGELKSSRFDVNMQQWFDIWSLEAPDERQDIQKEGLTQSVTRIIALIESEARIVPHDRIILAGISQGCATAIYALLQLRQPLGGFIGLSSWLPFQQLVSCISETYPGSEIERLRHIRAAVANENGEDEEHGSVCNEGACLRTPVLLAHCKDDMVILEEHGVGLRDTLTKLGLKVEWHDYEEGGHWLNEPQGVDDLIRFIQKI